MYMRDDALNIKFYIEVVVVVLKLLLSCMNELGFMLNCMIVCDDDCYAFMA